jgi:hypothetical protein
MDHELFQVTITFGNFDSREEARDFCEALKQEHAGYTERFIDGEIKGSWR